MKTNHQRGVEQYSIDTLEAIARDLGRNKAANRRDSWESQRLHAIRHEIERRRRALK